MIYRFARKLSCMTISGILITVLSACSAHSPSASKNSPRPGDADDRGKPVIASESMLTVRQVDGSPVEGAHILIGVRPGVPFTENFLTTDANGQVAVPASWTSAQPITIDGGNALRTTYFNQLPGGKVLVVKKAVASANLELNGMVSKYNDVVNNDDVGDVGLVYTALSRSALASLPITQLVSPQTDTIKVVGQSIDFPSNISIPAQKEKYLFFSVNLNKPAYRMYMPFASTWKIVSTHMTFPFKKTIDDARSGKSFVEMINAFDLKEASINDVLVNRSQQTSNLEISNFRFQPALQFTAPNFDNRYSMIALSVPESDGLFFLADIKKMSAGETLQLKAPTIGMGNGMIVSVFKRNDGKSLSVGASSDQLSAVVLSANQSQSFDYLDVVDEPKISGQTLVVTAPNVPNSIDAAMTYAVLDQIEHIQKNHLNLEKKTPKWELYSEGWTESFELPELPDASIDKSGTATDHRWEVVFGGVSHGSRAMAIGPNSLGKLTHVSRTAVDF